MNLWLLCGKFKELSTFALHGYTQCYKVVQQGQKSKIMPEIEEVSGSLVL